MAAGRILGSSKRTSQARIRPESPESIVPAKSGDFDRRSARKAVMHSYHQHRSLSPHRYEDMPSPKKKPETVSLTDRETRPRIPNQERSIIDAVKAAYTSSMKCVVNGRFSEAKSIIRTFHEQKGRSWDSVKKFCEDHNFKGDDERLLRNLENLDQSLSILEKYHSNIFYGNDQNWSFGLSNDYHKYKLETFRIVTIFVKTLLTNKDFLNNLDYVKAKQVLKVTNQYLIWVLNSRRLTSRVHSFWMDAYNTLCEIISEKYPDEEFNKDFSSLFQQHHLNKTINQSIDTSGAFSTLIKEFKELRKNEFNHNDCLRIACASRLFSDKFLHFEITRRPLNDSEISIKTMNNILFYGCCILSFGPCCFHTKIPMKRGSETVMTIELARHLPSLGKFCIPHTLMHKVLKPVISDILNNSYTRHDRYIQIIFAKDCGALIDFDFFSALKYIQNKEFDRAKETLDRLLTRDLDNTEKDNIELAHSYRYCMAKRDRDAAAKLHHHHTNNELYNFYAVCNMLVMCGQYSEAQTKIVFIKKYLANYDKYNDIRFLPFQDLLDIIATKKADPRPRTDSKRIHLSPEAMGEDLSEGGSDSDAKHKHKRSAKKTREDELRPPVSTSAASIQVSLPYPVDMVDQGTQTTLSSHTATSLKAIADNYQPDTPELDLFNDNTIEVLQDRLEKMKEELTNNNVELEKLNKEHSQLLRKSEDLEIGLNNKQTAYCEIENKLQTSEDSLKQQKLEHQEQVSTLQENLKRISEELSEALLELEAQRKGYTESVIKAGSYQSDLAAQKHKTTTLEADIVRLEKKNTEVSNKYKESINKHKKTCDTYNNLLKDYERKKEEVENLKHQTNQQHSKLKEHKHTDQTSSSSTPATSIHHDIKPDSAGLEPIGYAQLQAVSKFQATIKKLEQDLARAKEDLNTAREDATHWEKEHGKATHNRNVDYRELTIEKKRLENERIQYRDRAHNAEDSVMDLERKLQDKETELASLKTNHQEQLVQIQRIRDSEEELRRDTISLREENTKQQERIRHLDAHLHNMELKHKNELETEINISQDTQKQLIDSKEALTEKERQLTDNLEQISNLELEISTMAAESLTLNNTIASIVAEKMQLSELIDSLNQEKIKSTESQEHNKHLETKLDEKERLLSTLNNQLQYMETNQLKQMNDKIHQLEKDKIAAENRESILNAELRGKNDQIALKDELSKQQNEIHKQQKEIHEKQLKEVKADIEKMVYQRAHQLYANRLPQINEDLRQQMMFEQQQTQGHFPHLPAGRHDINVRHIITRQSFLASSNFPGSSELTSGTAPRGFEQLALRSSSSTDSPYVLQTHNVGITPPPTGNCAPTSATHMLQPGPYSYQNPNHGEYHPVSTSGDDFDLYRFLEERASAATQGSNQSPD
ncbi:hypothetical protein M3P05_05625 [Sansalvadorimonas sp. 2012CJ34-2]|uniref:Uncharacterized protein n=1 Tax=Parendozoicomonas callyspongiae TaxID=2942213 RepID=A0ABT0PDI0_9GAMM|nr:hypothetical protein [Sansalvadorimonas sp. 2012CJ34-2]MCL6269424.1 hypothetical protein [Sansalvadorimonas sp. 2012CJ34-2]